MFVALQKGTKNALETGRTFATLFADIELRQQLICVNSHDEFKKLLWEHTKELAEEQSHPERKLSGPNGGAGAPDPQAVLDDVLVCCGALLPLGSHTLRYWSFSTGCLQFWAEVSDSQLQSCSCFSAQQ